MATVVSHGAVFRATDKGTGPRRQIFMNYGRLQYEEYDPKQFPSHKNFEIYHNELNGKDYIKDCISWMIKKVGVACLVYHSYQRLWVKY